MGVRRFQRMAEDVDRAYGSMRDVPFRPSARHRDSAYGLETFLKFGVRFVPLALEGQIGPTSIAEIARDFDVPEPLVEAFFQQADKAGELNFVSKGIVAGQIKEIAREVTAERAEGRLVLVRTQPTSPLVGVRRSYAGKEAFGLSRERATGTFDTMFATFRSPFQNDREISINLGGYVPALEKDRAQLPGEFNEFLSDIQRLSIDSPTEAMFSHAGAVGRVIGTELPSDVNLSSFIFLKGRFEGPEESEYLSSPTHTTPIVGHSGYQEAARAALGDNVNIVIEAEGSDPGLEARHQYVNRDGRRFSSGMIKDLIAGGRLYKLDRKYLTAEHRGVILMLLPGELRAELSDGGYEGGMGFVQLRQDDSLRWFLLPNKANGKPAWPRGGEQRQEMLERLVEDLALIEADDSTAGHERRQQFESLKLFDIPMSHPCGRENVWRLAAAVRQSTLPDAPFLEVASA